MRRTDTMKRPAQLNALTVEDYFYAHALASRFPRQRWASPAPPRPGSFILRGSTFCAE